MTKLLYAIVVGLIGAAIVHIAIVLLIPSYAPRDAWSRLAAAGDLYTVAPISGDTAGAGLLVGEGDPLFRAAACRFDLTDGALHLVGTGRLPFWSMSIRDRAGQTTFSLSDRASTQAALNVIVLTPLQMIEMRRSLAPSLDEAVFIESETQEGIAVVRIFVPDPSWSETADTFLRELSCTPL
ncbi:MAG TPA: DUF1254 domain-containing protein [Tianweitania sediminis]|jgi:uncharacterized membrane protein|nr:DUF1254 domain-containing protein [Tianweitania sediminis]